MSFISRLWGTSQPAQSSETESVPVTKTICVIGAGSAGLAALKAITDHARYKQGEWAPTAFEARPQVGGVWAPAPPEGVPPETPLYDALHANVAHPILAHEDFLFPPSTPLYPPAATLAQYHVDFARHFDLNRHIRLSTRVTGVRWDATSAKFLVTTIPSTAAFAPVATTLNGQADGKEEHAFNFIIVANGHYHFPRYPSAPGLPLWIDSGKASHSVYYRRPDPYAGKTVLVVGAGASGQDVTSALILVAHTVIQSVPGSPNSTNSNLKIRGRLVDLRAPDIAVFEDGTEESGIDHAILATGYQVWAPFLSDVKHGFSPVTPPALPKSLYNSTYHFFPLYQQIWPLQSDFPPHALAFVGQPVGIVPMPTSGEQAVAVVKAFDSPSSLDLRAGARNVTERYKALKARYGSDEAAIGKWWHRFTAEGEQWAYRNWLYDFIEPGTKKRVPEWVIQMSERGRDIRRTWKELERTGEASEWVEGVGEGGKEEWVDLLRRVLARADKEKEEGRWEEETEVRVGATHDL